MLIKIKYCFAIMILHKFTNFTHFFQKKLALKNLVSVVLFTFRLYLDNAIFQIDDMNSKEIIQRRRLNHIDACFCCLE
ncbi:hypothetical protein BpHYR1_039566 [Brachionus plicatilis]|uniref:Uncharacterized protein n=1 Tax=Brachionus plicatilis TaxID=10195 RepID=A0A3M7QSG0_BRAPC|nr:hypothetical protein BpHYR1_039566 [Brachionus plicatilis]